MKKRLFERVPIRKEEGLKAILYGEQEQIIGQLVEINYRGLRLWFEINKKPSFKKGQELKARLDLSGLNMEVVMQVSSQGPDWIGFEFVDMLDVDREYLADLMEAKLVGSKLGIVGEDFIEPMSGCKVHRYHGEADEWVFLWCKPEEKKLVRFQCVIGRDILEWEEGHLRNGVLIEKIDQKIADQGWIPPTSIALSLSLESKFVWFVKSMLYTSPIPDEVKHCFVEVFK